MCVFVSRCVHAVRAVILEDKWLQEEHLLALKGPSSVTSSPKLNFPGTPESSSSKKVEIISFSRITKQNEVKVCSKPMPETDAEVSPNLPCEEISVVHV